MGSLHDMAFVDDINGIDKSERQLVAGCEHIWPGFAIG
jgi:hypothetical protein